METNPFLQKFNQLNRKIEEFYHEIALRQGISDSTFWILYSLLELGDGCLQRDICMLSHLNKQTVNSSVKKLMKEGKIRLEPGVGREMRIFLTEAGKAWMLQKIIPVMEAENEVFNEMSISEKEQLLDLTEKYLVQFKKKINQIFQL